MCGLESPFVHLRLPPRTGSVPFVITPLHQVAPLEIDLQSSPPRAPPPTIRNQSPDSSDCDLLRQRFKIDLQRLRGPEPANCFSVGIVGNPFDFELHLTLSYSTSKRGNPVFLKFSPIWISRFQRGLTWIDDSRRLAFSSNQFPISEPVSSQLPPWLLLSSSTSAYVLAQFSL